MYGISHFYQLNGGGVEGGVLKVVFCFFKGGCNQLGNSSLLTEDSRLSKTLVLKLSQKRRKKKGGGARLLIIKLKTKES